MAKPPILSKSPAAMKASVVKPAIMESSPASRGMQGKLTINTGSLPKSVAMNSPTPTTPEMMNLFKTLKPRPPAITERSPAFKAAMVPPRPKNYQKPKTPNQQKAAVLNAAAALVPATPKKKAGMFGKLKSKVKKTVYKAKRKMKYGF